VLDLDTIEQRAREAISFGDGLEDGGMHQTARRLRLIARDVLELVPALKDERSGRMAMQANYKRCLDVLGQRADRGIEQAARE
jgi:hypothetical protein